MNSTIQSRHITSVATSPVNQLGAIQHAAGDASFLVWAPLAKQVQRHVVAPIDLVKPMKREEHGYWSLAV
jgi:1,4-alpha-glucan branching enzyme